MTVTPATDPSGAVAPYDPDAVTGLEDFDIQRDAVMRRLRIDMKKAVFVDSLTNEEFSEVEAVLLGLVKQRVLWSPEVKEGDTPLCKSLDAVLGHPDVDHFPWVESKFDKGTVLAEHGANPTLPCANCNLKEWGTNPRGNNPWCAEQHTLPLMMSVGDGQFAPAILTVQRSGITPSRQYLTGFKQKNVALYTVVTTLKLSAQKRGGVDFAVPVFVKGDETDETLWPMFAENFRTIREFLHTPRDADDTGDGDGDSTTPSGADPWAATPDASAAGTASATAAPAAATAAPVEDDDIPF